MSEVRQKIKKSLIRYLSASLSFLLIILIIIILLFNRIVIFIEPGEGGVLYKLFFGGTVTTKVYQEGIQFIWPWDTMYIYNARVQEYPHEFDALTKNGLDVHLQLSVRYRPEYKLLGVLHKEVGEDYVNIVVLPEIENVLRVLIGSLDAEEIYTTKQSLLEKAINGAIEQIARRYVQVDDVIIKSIELPASVAESIQKKIEQKHVADAYVFRLQREEQEKERKRIEAEGLERFRKALSPSVLQYMGIQATLELSKSENAKIVVVGGGKDGGLPIIGNMPLSFPDNPSTSSDIDESSSAPQSEFSPDNSIKEPVEKIFAVSEAVGEPLSDSRPQVAEIARTENINIMQFSENQTVVR
ncbi:MAG: prohibitin family protein [Candidatus Electrothrix sp. AS4_5]|nr:prohibitin family protein [Candidatus Electrothrix gigas]MCI5189286.1 prohibitin family protein [Candidatus Electrothrix gigas]